MILSLTFNYLQINKIDCDSKCISHSFNCYTLVGFQELRVNDGSDLPHVVPKVWVQIPIQLNVLSQPS